MVATHGAEGSRAPGGADGHASRSRSELGLVLLGGLLAAALGLQWIGTRFGAPAWPGWLLLAFGGAALALYLVRVFPLFRRLEEEMPAELVRWRRLEGEISDAFEQLGAGDVVRSLERTQGLPRRLAAMFEAAAEALSSLAQQIQDSSIEVASAADAVHHISSDLASGSSEQAASVVEITAAMEQLARTASLIAENATHQAELAARAEASGDQGAAAVEEAVVGVEEVQSRISAIAERADALGTRSKEIYRVLDLINEIAQETHILSLNAAIEAVAAGADGRRFSVVAEEVRRLAERSQESVSSVRNLLDEFASSIRATILATEEGSKEAARVFERSRAAALAIGQLRQAAADTSRVARQISLATQQQNAASDEVVMTLREVNQVVQRMTGGLKELTGTADRLNQLGLMIQLLAQSFHLDSPRSLKHTVEGWARRLSELDPARLEETLAEKVEADPFIELAYVVDAQGKVVSLVTSRAVASKGRMGDRDSLREVDLKRRPWFRAVIREQRTSLTPPYESLLTGEACFTVAAPLFGSVGELLGVLAVDVNATGWTRI